MIGNLYGLYAGEVLETGPSRGADFTGRKSIGTLIKGWRRLGNEFKIEESLRRTLVI